VDLSLQEREVRREYELLIRELEMKVKENEEELAELRGYYEALLWMMQSENEVVSKRT
jgi:hypothetical protein